MNKALIAALAAGALVSGLILAPTFGVMLWPFDKAAAQSTGMTKKVTLVASEKVLQVAPDNALHPGGVMYNAMVFNGTIPAPVISVDQGDKVQVTLKNEGKVVHSLDFHAAITTTGANSGPVKVGENKTWTFDAVNAGAFFYHCSGDGLNGIWEHVANGMYGAVVVHPMNEKPAKEFYVVFGQIYSDNIKGVFEKANGTGSFDMDKFLAKQPDLVLTNGMAHKYVPSIGGVAKLDLNKNATVFKVKPGEQTRWYIVNAGPNDFIAFHFIGAQLDVKDGSILNRYGTQDKNDETWTIPTGSASVIEAVFPAAGVYVGVDHELTDVVKGAAFAVVADDNEKSMAKDQPEGTWVPPRGSNDVSNSNMTSATSSNVTTTFTGGTNATEAHNATSTGNATTTGNNNNQTTNTGNQTMGSGNNQTSGGNTTSTSGGSSIAASIVSGASTKSTGAFSPNPISAKVGDTVTWTNNDSQPHTVTSGTVENGAGKPDGKFDSSPSLNPLLTPGNTFSHKFTEAGDYPYFCQLHPTMVGKVSIS
jgi:nitrite reductase (NO-forming)